MMSPGVSLLFFNMGYSLGGALSIGSSSLLKKNDKPLFDGYILIVPCIRPLCDHWTPENIKEAEEKSKLDPPQEVSFQSHLPQYYTLLKKSPYVDPYSASRTNSRSLLVRKHILDDE